MEAGVRSTAVMALALTPADAAAATMKLDKRADSVGTPALLWALGLEPSKSCCRSTAAADVAPPQSVTETFKAIAVESASFRSRGLGSDELQSSEPAFDAARRSREWAGGDPEQFDATRGNAIFAGSVAATGVHEYSTQLPVISTAETGRPR